MNVELKKFRPHEDLSEETLAFSAQIWIDGKMSGHVRNRGCGGSHDYGFTDPETREALEAHARQVPGEKFEELDELIDWMIAKLEEARIVKANRQKGLPVTVLIQKGAYEVNGKTFYRDEYYVGITDLKFVEALANKQKADKHRVVS